MDDARVLDLIDTLYGCATGQQDWETFLKKFAEIFPTLKPALAGYDSQFSTLNLWLIEGIPEDAVRAYAEHYYKINPWGPMLQSLPLGPQVHWGDTYMPREEIMKTEFYNDFVRPMGELAGGFGTMLVKEPDRFLTFHANFEYKHIDEAETAARCVELLWPHLVRAFELTRRLEDVALLAGALEGVLNRLAVPVFVIDAKLKLRFANAPADALLREGKLFDTRNVSRLRLRAAADDRTLREQLAGMENSSGSFPSIYFRLKLPLERPFAGFLSRLRLDHDSVLQRPKRIITPQRLYALFLISPKQRIETDVEAICAVLGVTRAEARLAQALLNGQTLQQHAVEARISYHTVRSHMKSLIAKTEANSQSELIQNLTKIFWR